MNINTKSLIAAATLAIVGSSAFASETYGQQLPTASTLSRAAVSAELVRARQAGEIAQSAEAYSHIDASVKASRSGSVSRAEVRQELAQARNDRGYATANEAYGTASVRGGAAE